MKTETYGGSQGFGKTGKALEEFGEKQNALNARLSEHLDALARQFGEAMDRIAELEAARRSMEEQVAHCLTEMDGMQKEIDRLRLTAKLNSNTIDRLVKKQ